MNRDDRASDLGVVSSSTSQLELLVLRAQSGEQQAHTGLVDVWHESLVRQADRLLDDRDLARDAAQDAWAGILRGLCRLDDPAAFPAWSLRIVTRRAIDLRRRRQATARAEAEVAELGARTGDPADRDRERGETEERLHAAITRLDRDHRVVVELQYLEGLSLREIAHVLDVPVGTVKSRSFHARLSLRAALGEPEPSHDP